MLSLVLGAIALAAFFAVLVLSPSDPDVFDSEAWFEQFGSRGRRDTFAEELAVMRLESEIQSNRAVGKAPARPTRMAPRPGAPAPRQA